MRLNIAIDGPAGAGKSTVARALAQSLSILYLDTGAMYRAAGLKALRDGLNPAHIEDIDSFLKTVQIAVDYRDSAQVTFLGGEDVSAAIREHRVSRAASDISAIPAVRVKLVALQREIAQKQDLVLDGRDIGTYVLPGAPIKFYLTASVDERANRRYKELLAKGQPADFDTVKADITARDNNDMNRAFAPLSRAEDAVNIDSTKMTPDEVLALMLDIVREKRK